MRKYKFRGKRVEDSKWIYGYLADDNYINNMSKIAIPCEEVAPATVGQFTGLTDRDGKEIYAGDILIEPSVATIPLEVKYNEMQGAFCLIEHTHTEGALLGTCPLGDMLRHYPFMKVVGNIYDNPEILTKWQTN